MWGIAIFLITVATSALSAGAAYGSVEALWGEEGTLVLAASDSDYAAVRVPDDTGGMYLLAGSFGEARSTLRLQRIGSDGSAAWGSDGLLLAEALAEVGPLWDPIGATTDGVLGALGFWLIDGQVFGQRVGPDGREMWQPGGAPLFGHPEEEDGCRHRGDWPERFGAVSDDAGGAVILVLSGADSSCTAREIFAQRVDSRGAPLWGSRGVQVTYESEAEPVVRNVIGDGEGGIILAYSEGGAAGAPVYAERLDAAGGRSWPSRIELARPSAIFDHPDFAIVGDGERGFLWAWTAPVPGTSPEATQILAQRADENGQSIWQDGGIAVTSSEGSPRRPLLLDDGSGGVIVVYARTDADLLISLRGQRISSAGTIGWTVGGVPVFDAVHLNAQSYPQLVSADEGEVIVATDAEAPQGWRVAAQKLDGSGNRLWPVEGITVREVDESVAPLGLAGNAVSDGRGGVIVTWPTDLSGDVAAQRVSDSPNPFASVPVLRTEVVGGLGRFEAADGTVACTGSCEREFPEGFVLYLDAVPQPGFRFVSWEGSCAGSDSCVVTMSEDHVVSAIFAADPEPTPDSIGVYSPSYGYWFLDRSRDGNWSGCDADGCVGPYGIPGDRPIPGGWSGSDASWLGVFRPSTGHWYLEGNGNGSWEGCTTDTCLGAFGMKSDVPVAGDWTGAGVATIGVFRPTSGYWYLDGNGNGAWDGCVLDICSEWFGLASDQPVAGDWAGLDRASIGVFREASGEWFLEADGNRRWDGCAIDRCAGPFGMKGDKAVVGDWTGDGKKNIGVFRPKTGHWYLDANGNGLWDGCSVDLCKGPFGLPTDRPVVGKW